MTLHKIRLELELDKPSGIYTITSPDVPGLITEGSTPKEIMANVQEALQALMTAWKELGKLPLNKFPISKTAFSEQSFILTMLNYSLFYQSGNLLTFNLQPF